MDSAAKTIQVDYEVKILSPFHVGTGYGLASLVDSRTVRDREGLAYIPGSTVKGLVREGFRKVASLFGTDIVLCGAECGECLECVVFGTARKPGILAFGDARLPEKKALEIDELFENHRCPGTPPIARQGPALVSPDGRERRYRDISSPSSWRAITCATRAPFSDALWNLPAPPRSTRSLKTEAAQENLRR